MTITKLNPRVQKGRGKQGAGQGRVYLVGAGPGSADLLTVKALRIIQSADLILFDQLVSEEIRDLFPSHTPALFVGKVKDDHSIAQDQLNELLVAKAKQGLNVCRLKGGDPFIFGRGGEEMLALKSAGVQVELVPGITAATGCSGYAGIPLTHRGIAQGCSFITAHGEKELDISWRSLVDSKHTLVFYMGLSRAGWISKQLQTHGMNPATPVAFVENGCRQEQRTVVGMLNEMEELALRGRIQSPALIIVGDVVSLSQQLDWFAGTTGLIEHKLSA